MAKVFTSNLDEALSLIAEQQLRFVDLRFTDLLGKDQHLTIPTTQVDESLFREGKTFDGSSIRGWKDIDESDMLLMPDPVGVVIDPFFNDKTAIVRCDILSPGSLSAYERDPRSIARRAEVYLKETGIADKCFLGPEPEFFIFDDVRWEVGMMGASYHVDSSEAAFNSGKMFDRGNFGHRPAVKGGYFSMPPIDSAQDIRSHISLALDSMNIEVEAHHHEVATGCQNEISTRFNSLVKKADEMQRLKYVVRNAVHAHGKTATFMPKPLVGDNGSGMHCHVSLAKGGDNLFAGDLYSGLSQMALHFIGGVLKHARCLNVFTNPTTNSYKRLVPGYEAPVLLAYSACNRSAAVRVPYVESRRGKRIEVRFPDAMANPYLAFSAILMAGLDGIENKIDPGDAMDKNLYDIPASQLRDIPTVCASLRESVKALWSDCDFLLKGNVFNEDVLNAYTQLLNERITKIDTITHPVEFEEYYSL